MLSKVLSDEQIAKIHQASLDMLVMQHEVISYVESVMREIDFSDDALAIDELEKTGPGGILIDRVHTATHFRKKLWFPKLLDREYYQKWLDDGAVSMEERCRRTKEQILRTHQAEPIPDDLGRALDKIVAAAQKELN